MIEQFDSYTLTAFEQGILFALAGFVSMMYHYVDRYIKTRERLLDNLESIWHVIQVFTGMVLGSTLWSSLGEVSNTEVVVGGMVIGLAAFGKGISELRNTNEKER